MICKIVVFTCVALLSVSCWAELVPNKLVVRDEINKCLELSYKSQALMNCLNHEYAVQDAMLNKVYSALMSRLKGLPEADLAVARSRDMPELLIKAQRKWIALRDSECHLIRSVMSGQWLLSDEMGYKVCMIEYSNDRARQINGYMECDFLQSSPLTCLLTVG